MSAKGVERFARFGRAMGASVPQLFRAGFEPVRDDITLADVNKANAKFYSADGGGYGRDSGSYRREGDRLWRDDGWWRGEADGGGYWRGGMGGDDAKR